LVPEDLHSDQISFLRGVSGVNELAGGLVDGDEPLILKEELERGSLRFHMRLVKQVGNGSVSVTRNHEGQRDDYGVF